MVVKTNWPGATAHEVEQQVTDRIERKLQEVAERRLGAQLLASPASRWCSSRSRTPRRRRRCPTTLVPGAQEDRRHPQPRCPPASRARSSTTSSATPTRNIYALTGDGFGYRELKDFGDRVRAELLRVPGVAKVDFIGEQDEKIFIELSNTKLATLGVEPAQIIADARAAERGGRRPACSTPRTDRIYVRPTGAFDSVDAIRDIAIRANNRVFRLGDIAKVTRGYVDPPQQKMRWQGKEALGIGVTMVKGGDVIELGHDLDARDRAHRSRQLPVGRRARAGREHAARGAALDQPVPALARPRRC